MTDISSAKTDERKYSNIRIFWEEKSAWLLDHPAWTMVILAILGLAFRFRWLNTAPLVAGDQGWPTIARFATYFPWPGFWDTTHGIGN